MNVGLINAPTPTSTTHSKLNPPLGLAYIGSYLIKEGCNVKAIDMNLSGYNEKRIKRFAKKNPDLVGISAQTESLPNALKIADKIKDIDKGIDIALGGPHPTLKPKEVLSNEYVDYVVVGEGEKTILELLKHIDNQENNLEEIKGLAYSNKGNFCLNERRDPLDPSNLPWPARNLFPLKFYDQPWTVLTSRGGCPFECPFCSVSEIWKNKKRYRKPSDIAKEIKYLLNKERIRFVFMVDDTLTLSREWTINLLNELNKIDQPFNWGCSTRIDLVDKELLEKMRKSGCSSIQFGMETGSQSVLNEVKNGISKEIALNKIDFALDLGINVACSFMFPHPYDNEETIRETKDYMKKLSEKGAKILLSCTSPFPGTKYRKKAEELGINILTDDWSKYDAKHLVMETRNLSKSKLENLLSEISNYVGLKTKKT
ncbi:MAG: Radical SAM superfamily enzyme [Candidatus Methanohalarchaeum thermophilum]|uniref:Radical SAM superfamily enzyme n=1 Tax=Methanohalarchaeum thermophilum TaxID=1903181 RepID=A0A1Q6DWZ8_METT1|nr:MAG: Radical SAM superfamily enzyme [Candidatus Methanohalarchaeum thermophilum]